jgi:predicted glycogen debranching enzyme
MTLSFQNNAETIFSCSLQEQVPSNLQNKWKNEIKRRESTYEKLTGNSLQKHLQMVGMSFIDRNPCLNCKSIVAGYHWFLEWGRDAMISLPSLTLFSEMENDCLEILKEFARNEHDGVIPNYLGDKPENNAYNSVDAGLWFAWAVQQYSFKTKNVQAIDKYLWITLKNIFINYKNGTLYNIKMADDCCLLYAGSKEVNLTWMDAMVSGVPVTPRYGFAVEVNALWYNMLCFMRMLAVLFSDPIRYELDPIIAKINDKFTKVFWNERAGCLYDYVNDGYKCEEIRPNQIFAVSLNYSPLSKKNAEKVVEVVKVHLLTPYGLRTLSPKDPNYIGNYSGNSEERDKAYHNGTVWPWLLGHFGEAVLKVSTSQGSALDILLPCLLALKNHLYTSGIGTISEIFSGDAPHHPNGCISQAWSVAEILRLTYLLNIEV